MYIIFSRKPRRKRPHSTLLHTAQSKQRERTPHPCIWIYHIATCYLLFLLSGVSTSCKPPRTPSSSCPSHRARGQGRTRFELDRAKPCSWTLRRL